MARPLASAACLVAYLLLLSPGEASSVVFTDEAGPEQAYLQGRYRFFVAASSISDGVVSWKLSNVKLQVAEAIEPGAFLHAALVPGKLFNSLVEDQTPICDKAQSFVWSTQEGVVATTITTEPMTKNLKIPHGGPHMLVFANCGVPGATTISGSIGVQSSWGLLDNVDYYKVPVYLCALIFTFAAATVYLAIVVQQEEDVRTVQYYCMLLSIIGCVEAAAHCFNLYLENTGEHPWNNFVDALYLAKVMYAFMFILQMAQGLGFTVNRLECIATAKCYVVVCCYLLAVIPKICLFSMRPHLAAVHTRDVFISTGPLFGATMVALLYLSCSLKETLGILRKVDDTEGLQAAKRIALLVFVVVTVAAGTFCVQLVLGASQETIESLWMYVFWNDAVASASFLVATVVLMCLSMENHVGKSLQMGALPTQEVDLEEVDEETLQIDQMDEESAVVGGRGPAADTIGVTVALE